MLFRSTGTYFFPSTNPTAKYGLAAGIGYYSVGGSLETSGATPSSSDISGSGAGFHLMGVGEWTMSPNFAVTGSAGYRVASVELDRKPYSTTVNADYSGFMSRLGVVFYLPNAKK